MQVGLLTDSGSDEAKDADAGLEGGIDALEHVGAKHVVGR